jgi:hypothetical protein
MPTQVGIYNVALGRIGIDDFVENLTDQTNEANACNTFYETCRDLCLSAYPWPFATRRAVLDVLAAEPARAGWQYVYGLPAGIITPLYIYSGGQGFALYDPTTVYALQNPRAPRADQRIPYAIEASSLDDGQVLLCDYPTPTFVHVSSVIDPAKFDANFANALAWMLASEICMPLNVQPALEQKCRKQADDAIRDAIASALHSVQEDMDPDSAVITGRL